MRERVASLNRRRRMSRLRLAPVAEGDRGLTTPTCHIEHPLNPSLAQHPARLPHGQRRCERRGEHVLVRVGVAVAMRSIESFRTELVVGATYRDETAARASARVRTSVRPSRSGPLVGSRHGKQVQSRISTIYVRYLTHDASLRDFHAGDRACGGPVGPALD